MTPFTKPLLLYIRKCFIPLLCKCSSKIPGNHHIYVIFAAFYRRNNFNILRRKSAVKKIIHKHFNSKANGVRFSACNPFTAFFKQKGGIFCKCLRFYSITRSPVIHERQKLVNPAGALFPVFYPFY